MCKAFAKVKLLRMKLMFWMTKMLWMRMKKLMLWWNILKNLWELRRSSPKIFLRWIRILKNECAWDVWKEGYANAGILCYISSIMKSLGSTRTKEKWLVLIWHKIQALAYPSSHTSQSHSFLRIRIHRKNFFALLLLTGSSR